LAAHRIATVLAFGAICFLLGSCGFNDELTRRGFIKSGDQICVDTLVKTGLRFNANTSQPELLGAVGNAYGDAAARFRSLKVRSDDDPMRNKVVTRFTSFSNRLDAAAKGSAGAGEVESVFSQGAELEGQLKDYGFDVCGGGGGK